MPGDSHLFPRDGFFPSGNHVPPESGFVQELPDTSAFILKWISDDTDATDTLYEFAPIPRVSPYCRDDFIGFVKVKFDQLSQTHGDHNCAVAFRDLYRVPWVYRKYCNWLSPQAFLINDEHVANIIIDIDNNLFETKQMQVPATVGNCEGPFLYTFVAGCNIDYLSIEAIPLLRVLYL